MQTRGSLKSNNIFLLTLSIIFALSFILSPKLSLADITIDSYCQFCVQIMELEISNLQELISLKNQYQNDPDALSQQIAGKQEEYEQSKNTLFSSFGLTEKEYAMYMGKHGRQVEEYFEANPDIKQQIDDLSSQIRTLLTEYES